MSVLVSVLTSVLIRMHTYECTCKYICKCTYLRVYLGVYLWTLGCVATMLLKRDTPMTKGAKRGVGAWQFLLKQLNSATNGRTQNQQNSWGPEAAPRGLDAFNLTTFCTVKDAQSLFWMLPKVFFFSTFLCLTHSNQPHHPTLHWKRMAFTTTGWVK